ncbi:putative bifunctional diguanylate cyclase/phosphodiesterase [Ensifer soli]|uniref:putative bifunctional diguanylate cyclase/phosphodiesterase n=1 Tax=Ciceribacter sp. sgz301302 TaxID=3342379 RepID=UPI0035B96483
MTGNDARMRADERIDGVDRPVPPMAIERLLDALPFGLSLRTRRGERIYANPAAGSASTRPGMERRDFDIEVAGDAYTVSLALDETERNAREQTLIERAYFDELTGLPNRRLIEQSVASHAAASRAPFALVFIDVDRFKHVNDHYGHDAGDLLLVEIAKRLSRNLRPSDMLARLGGDEFLLFLSPLDDAATAEAEIRALSRSLSVPYYIGNEEIHSSASIGVSLYPVHGADYETLRANADRAMYRSKGSGLGHVQFFDDSIEHAAIEQGRREELLRLMVRERRVTCAYQPKFDIRSNTVCGVEVLLRFVDDGGNIIGPGGFIELAVELGMMDELCHLVVERTLDALDLIDETFGANVTISVNVAARQATDLAFMRGLLARIAASGAAGRFLLEITEEAFVSKASFQQQVLPLIRQIGAKVSIDDFGVGYSSLSALAEITADEVKIDRSFITKLHQRPRSQNVLRAIEALSHSLGMKIVVEGVEEREELDYLMAHTGIRIVQGYYFSKPVVLDRRIGDGPHPLALRSTLRPVTQNRAGIGR